MALYDLIWLLMLVYLPVVGGYDLSDTALGEKKGLFNKLKLKKVVFCFVFFCMGDVYGCLKCVYFYLFVSEY